jgi:hypothetical protein
VTTSLLQARQLISLLGEHGRDLIACSLAFDRWCAGHIKPWFEDHVYWDTDLIRRWSGQDVDLTRPLPPDLVMAAAQADPEIATVAGPYQAMRALPGSLDAVQTRARAIYATGWRPPVPPGPTRDELAGLVTAAASSQSYPADDAALSVIGGSGPPECDGEHDVVHVVDEYGEIACQRTRWSYGRTPRGVRAGKKFSRQADAVTPRLSVAS